MFQQGDFVGQYEAVLIDLSPFNHPSNAARYSKLDHYQIILKTIQSRAELYPRNKAFLYSTTINDTFTAPNDYTYYQFTLNNNALLSNDAMDFLMTCSMAESMVFFDSSDVATRFLSRIRSWENLKNLRSLHFRVSKQSAKQLKIRPFLQRLPALQSLALDTRDFSQPELTTFLAGQNLPSSWVGIRHGILTTSVVLHKRH